MVALIFAIQIFQIFLPKKKMYINLVIYIYTFILLLSLVLYTKYLWTKEKLYKIPTKNLYRDNIKTGDIFLLDWQRYNNIFISSLFDNSFMHPSIALWEKGDLYIIELINYFGTDKYKGLIKIPFNKWYRINKKAIFLYNSLSIKDEKNSNKDLRKELSEKILDFYHEYKGSIDQPAGLGRDWLRFWYPQKEYQKIKNFDSIICTEIIAFMLKEVEIAEKDKSVESYTPDSFIGMKKFKIKNPYMYKEHFLVRLNEL